MILLPTVLAKDPRYHAALYCFLEKSVRNERNIMAGKGKRVEAVGYMRTSSTTNVGDGKDSEARQRRAIDSRTIAMSSFRARRLTERLRWPRWRS